MDQIQDVSTNEPSTTTTITTNHPLVADDFVAVTNFEGSAVKLDDHRPSLTQLFHDRDRCYANRYPAELPCNAAILNSSKCVAVEHDDSNGNRIVNIVENHEILGGYVSVSATIVAMHVSSTTDGAEESTRPQDVWFIYNVYMWFWTRFLVRHMHVFMAKLRDLKLVDILQVLYK